jgi:hypothetical protein
LGFEFVSLLLLTLLSNFAIWMEHHYPEAALVMADSLAQDPREIRVICPIML